MTAAIMQEERRVRRRQGQNPGQEQERQTMVGERDLAEAGSFRWGGRKSMPEVPCRQFSQSFNLQLCLRFPCDEEIREHWGARLVIGTVSDPARVSALGTILPRLRPNGR